MTGATQSSETLGDLFSQLVSDAKGVAHAEIGVYKASALERLGLARGGLIKLAVGAALMFCALLALILGCLLALAELIGPLLAGLAMAVGCALIGLILLLSGRKDVARISRGKFGEPVPTDEELAA